MILVVAEQKEGRLNRASWEAVAAAQALAAGASPITIAVFGGDVAAAAQELAAADVAGTGGADLASGWRDQAGLGLHR